MTAPSNEFVFPCQVQSVSQSFSFLTPPTILTRLSRHRRPPPRESKSFPRYYDMCYPSVASLNKDLFYCSPASATTALLDTNPNTFGSHITLLPDLAYLLPSTKHWLIRFGPTSTSIQFTLTSLLDPPRSFPFQPFNLAPPATLRVHITSLLSIIA